MTGQGLRGAHVTTKRGNGPVARRSAGLGIDARGAGHTLRGGRQVLRPVSVSIRPGSLVAIIGPSGSGKTLLLDALAGVTLPTEGVVLHDGATCRPSDDLAAAPIGYVPQDDIIHQTLPLDKTLRYAARLRLPARTTEDQIDQEVAEVLAALGLTAQASTQVRLLSGGERKRASIAVELLSRPNALFLDEPTSGLDPAIAADLVELLGRIAAAGTTVVFTSHNPQDLAGTSLVLVLAAHGQLAFADSPANALAHFRAQSYDEIYRRLVAEPDPDVWAARLPAEAPTAAPVSQNRTARGPVQSPGRRLGGFGQWRLLTRRSLDLLTRSWLTLAILLGSPLIIIVMFLMMFRPGAFAYDTPSPNTSMMIVFWIAFGGFFFGLTYGLSQISDEFPILRRERIVGVRIAPYLASKFTVLLPVLAAVDALLLVTLSSTDRLPAFGAADWGRMFTTLLLCSAAALTLGLLAAAAVSSPSQATLMLPMLCFPQVLFVGAFLPVPVMALPGRVLSYLMSNRWAFDAMGNTAGLPQLWSSPGSKLGPPLLQSYGDTFDGSVPREWMLLAGFMLVFLIAAGLVLARKTPRRRRTSR
jgi:ABC-type multidrug transport system ATPase subunit